MKANFIKTTLWITACLSFPFLSRASTDRTIPAQTINFKKTILPILQNSCFACHNNTSGAPADVSAAILKKVDKEIGDAAEDFSMNDSFPFDNDEPAAKQLKQLEKQLTREFMPPDEQEKYHMGSPLSDQDRKTLLTWVAQEKDALK